jgi:RNA polymerase sigma factor (sigma-70 family)
MEKQQPIPITYNTKAKIEKTNLPASIQSRIATILGMTVSYIELPEFSKPSQMSGILEERVVIPIDGTITPDQEKVLFKQMNYARFRLCQLRRKLLRQKDWEDDTLKELLEIYRYQMDCRSNIVNGNMGLVLSLSRKSKYQGVDFTDLVSEGSVALLRAVEKFDFTKGFKFSTYACHAILKGFYRAAGQSYTYNERFPTQLENAHDKDDNEIQYRDTWRNDLHDEFEVIFDKNLARLNKTETSILKMRFSIGTEHNEPMTLKSVGERLGLTKERVRQIQNEALAKIKPVACERLQVK